MIVLVLLCGLVVLVPLILLTGAVILRAAVALANKVLANQTRQPTWEYDADQEEDDDALRQRSGNWSSAPIREPGRGRAMLIAFATNLVNFAVSSAIGWAVGVGRGAARADDQTAAFLTGALSLPVNLLLTSGMLTAVLPTSFPRACLVAVFQYLITAIVVLVVYTLVFAIRAGLRAGP